jgi:MFS family permease
MVLLAPLQRRLGNRWTLAMAATLDGAGLACWVYSLTALLGSKMLFVGGAFQGLSMLSSPMLRSILSQAAGDGEQAATLGCAANLEILGAALAPLAFGPLFDWFDANSHLSLVFVPTIFCDFMLGTLAVTCLPVPAAPVVARVASATVAQLQNGPALDDKLEPLLPEQA